MLVLAIGLHTCVWNATNRLQSPAQSKVDWKTVVEKIRAGDPAAEETLYRNLASGARLFLRRRLGTQSVDDLVHDLFVVIIQAIRRGDLREPERLMGFVRTVLNRQFSLAVSQVIRKRQTSVALESAGDLTAADPTPEQQSAMRQKVALMKQTLKQLNDREFEVLTRFYLREESPQRIRIEMGLTQTQFDLLKSRAKAKLTFLVQRKLARDPISRK